MDDNRFGDYIRKMRREQNITLTELAQETGLSQGYLSQIERGDRPIPSIEILTKLKDSLDADAIEFMNKAGFIPHVESLGEAFGFKKVRSKNFTDLYTLLDRTDLDLYYKTNKITRDDRLFLKILLDKIFSDA